MFTWLVAICEVFKNVNVSDYLMLELVYKKFDVPVMVHMSDSGGDFLSVSGLVVSVVMMVD